MTNIKLLCCQKNSGSVTLPCFDIRDNIDGVVCCYVGIMVATARLRSFVYISFSRHYRLDLVASGQPAQGRHRAGWCASVSSDGFLFPRPSFAYSGLKSTQDRRLRYLERSQLKHTQDGRLRHLGRRFCFGMLGLHTCAPVSRLRRGFAAVVSGTGGCATQCWMPMLYP